jgi:dolichol-phosphate mannosyltransferase
MKIVVIIPTYNERGNIGRLIDALDAYRASMGHDLHLLVVDDNSPDGTIKVVEARQRDRPHVHALTGTKVGLGAAYIRGMEYAMESIGADVIVEMDADFSHKPEDLPRLLSEIDAGADFVIGSRYVVGGSIPKEWGFHRKLNSAAGNFIARHVAGMHRIRDCTAGFRAIRTTLLKRIQLHALRVQGYAFQVALLHAALIRGAKIVEIPVEFVDRSIGESKLGLRDIIEFVLNAWWIRFQSSRTFIKFVLVGASGVVINIGTFSLLLHYGINKFIASPIAIEVSIITNFLLNNFWTFRWRHLQSGLRVRGLKFNVVSLVALAVSYSSFVLLSLVLQDVSSQLIQLVCIVPATLINYFLNSYWTFRDGGKKQRQPCSVETVEN